MILLLENRLGLFLGMPKPCFPELTLCWRDFLPLLSTVLISNEEGDGVLIQFPAPRTGCSQYRELRLHSRALGQSMER